RANLAFISSRTAPTNPIAAKSARLVSRTCRQWIFSVAGTCSLTFRPSSARSTLCSGRLTANGRPPSRAPGTAAQELRIQRGESHLGEGSGEEISGRPAGVCDHSTVVACAGTVGWLAAGGGNPSCRRFPRHGAHSRARSRDVLYHVFATAGRQKGPRAGVRY